MASDAMTIDQQLQRALAPFATGTASLSKQMENVADQLSLLNTGGPTSVSPQVPDTAKSSGERGSGVIPVLAGIGAGIAAVPFFNTLASLFGGGEKKELPPLVEFAFPESLRVNAGMSERISGGPFLIDHAQGHAPRPRMQASAQSNITVQVQAMDSRSFMDHSGDIARAVRQAMLDSSVLSDVIREV